MMQMNEDEGFVQQPCTEYTEFSYSPCFNLKQTPPRPYFNPLRLKPLSKSPTPPQAYINDSLQNLLRQKFAANHSPIYRPTNTPINSILTFDSSFQSGNLEYVVPRNNVYELYMKPDTNTMTHFQWFYFKVKNRRPTTVTFVIKNLLKAKMSYLEGLKPYHCSKYKQNKQYEQIPGNVCFRRSEEENDTDLQFYELSFEYSFQASNDQVQFCSQPPYSYSRYCKIYKNLPFTRLEISRTVLGNKIDAYLVNQNVNSSVVVVLMARQHPGQTVGSWMMQGFVNKLIEAPTTITWILIPMVNIDGVIMGNNRTGVQGYDFNRHWYIDEQTNRYHLFPEIKGIIAYFKNKKKEYSKKIKIFIDFHGHSSQQNVFAYGPPHYKTSEHFQLSRILPYLISKRNNDFSLGQCSYCIEPSKKGCSRSVFLYKFGFTYSYTIESSFGLYRGRRINEKDMMRMGGDVFKSVVDFAGMMSETKEKSTVLKDVVNAMRLQVVETVPKAEGYDSDSDNQDENAPIRQGFQQKLVLMLTKEAKELETSLFNKIVKKRDNSIHLETEQRKIKINTSTPATRTDKKRRMRTEQDRKGSYGQQISAFLPRVRLERSTHSSKNKVVDPCDLDRLSLQQMKERLMRMKHSELGKRILIINSHQNC